MCTLDEITVLTMTTLGPEGVRYSEKGILNVLVTFVSLVPRPHPL